MFLGVILLLARVARAIGAFCFVMGGLALIVVTATQLISGTPTEGYPALSGQAGYGTYMWQVGIFTFVGALIGFPSWMLLEVLSDDEGEYDEHEYDPDSGLPQEYIDLVMNPDSVLDDSHDTEGHQPS